jgi:tetratricopeptide (TPR) repeat protein
LFTSTLSHSILSISSRQLSGIALLILLWTPLASLATCNDEANKARLENRIGDAKAILADCLDEGLSKVARTYLLLGLTHYESGDHKKAIQEYTNAIEIDPTYATAYVNRGLSRSIKGQYKDALNDFDHALQLQPGNMQAYYFRAAAHERKKRYQLAIDDFSQSLLYVADDSELVNVYYHRGQVYRKMGNNEIASEGSSQR